MKRILFLVTLITMTTLVKSQNLIINDTVYKAGIYRTFEEFKYNNPSIDFNYGITTKNRGYGFLNAAGQVTYYRIMINKKLGKSIGNVFGFCDGKNVYINESLPRLSPKTGFMRIEYFGKYCYYEDRFCTTVYTGNGTTQSCELDEKLININTGEVIRLSKKTLRELIANDTKLLNEFNEQSQKNKKLKEFAIRYIENL
jgi:hypothetical protein